MTYGIIYLIIALLTALSFAAWDNGKRWDTGRYLFLGCFWPPALVVIAFVLIVRGIKRRVK